MSGKRAILPGLSLLILLGAACRFLSGATPPLPQLPPTAAPAPANLTLPELDVPQSPFSDVSLHEAAMRPGYEADLQAFAGATRYWMEVDISPASHVITGQQTVRYVNATRDTLDEVVFRLYPNHLAGREIMRLGEVVVDGQPVEPSLSIGATVLSVPLDTPLPPGGQRDISLTFGLTVPPDEALDRYGRLSDLVDVLSLPSFFPLLSVYDPETGDWWRAPLAADGDPVYSESALFEVWLTVPQDVVLATVGQTLDRADNGDGTAMHHIVTGPVRDFAIYMSADYELRSATENGLTVNVYSLPGGEADDAYALDTTQRAVEVYDGAFGVYPYAELDVVETGTSAGGIEYPGLFVLSDDIWRQGDSYFEIVIAHEAAHQWWYGLVGNDQVGQPWLDEGLAQYAEFVYFDQTAGPAAAEATHDFYAEVVNDYLDSGGGDLPVGLPVDAYAGQESYDIIVYFKAPLFFDLLANTYGQQAMQDFLQTYYETHRYSIASTDSLQHSAEETFGEDLDPLFAEWVTGE